jgi:hypothetical protein
MLIKLRLASQTTIDFRRCLDLYQRASRLDLYQCRLMPPPITGNRIAAARIIAAQIEARCRHARAANGERHLDDSVDLDQGAARRSR